MKAQPKVVAKTKKPAAKARPAVKVDKPATKAKPAAKTAAVPKPSTRPASKTTAKGAPTARTQPAAKAAPAREMTKTAPKAAKSVAGKAIGAVAKAVVSGAKAVVAAAKKIPAKTSAAAKPAPAKAAPPATAAPGAAALKTARAPATPVRAVQPPVRAVPPAPAQPAAPAAAKATYIPMANPSVLTPPPVVAIKKDPKLANNWKTKTAEELTDAEVLAMPDSEYMNEKQMAFFRLKLQLLKQEILNSAGETTEHLREDTVIVPDPADRATIEEEHALELRTRDRERKLLKKIEQSIARIDAGDYGYCDETGEPIGVGRLLARPTATLSLEAQQRRELKQKMFGD